MPQTPHMPTFELHDRISERVFHIDKETYTVSSYSHRRGTIIFAGFHRPNIFGVANPYYRVAWDDGVPDQCIYGGQGWSKIGHEESKAR